MIRNSIIDAVSGDLNTYRRLMLKFEDELKRLPEGSLCVKRIRGKERYYHYKPSGHPVISPARSYITKDNESLISALGRKKFLEKSLPVIKNIIDLEELFLKGYSVYDPLKIAESLPGLCKSLSCNPIPDMTEDHHPFNWLKEPYVTNPAYPEKLICKTPRGLPVRSKSELIIAAQLETEEIPFRYEAALSLPERTYYPDFTILNPRDNRIIYWEHFGMADDLEYADAMEQKLAVYRRYGIVQWVNLIVTFETKEVPLDAQKVKAIINAFLLP